MHSTRMNWSRTKFLLYSLGCLIFARVASLLPLEASFARFFSAAASLLRANASREYDAHASSHVYPSRECYVFASREVSSSWYLGFTSREFIYDSEHSSSREILRVSVSLVCCAARSCPSFMRARSFARSSLSHAGVFTSRELLC